MNDLAAEPVTTTTTAHEPGRRRRAGWSAFAIVLLILLVLGRLCSADFAEWDDPDTIGANPLFTLPLGEAIHGAWAHMYMGLYFPVTLSVWALLFNLAETNQPDSLGFLVNSWVFHTFNVLCHIGAALLVLAILRRLSRSAIAAWIGAAVFAIHPLQVETVAWASATKDLMCWGLALLATLIYLRALQSAAAGVRRSLWRTHTGSMVAVTALLAIALLCKPSAVVLPAALFVVDLLLVRQRPWRRIVIDLLPLFAIATAGAVVGRVAQYVSHIHAAPIWGRPFVMGDSLCHYLWKLICPTRLALDYGRTPQVALADRWTYVCWLIPLAVGVGAWMARRRAPQLLAAALIGVIGIGPVLGLATFQMQGYSSFTDHYVYFSMFGVAVAVAWVIDRLVAADRSAAQRWTGLTAAAAVLVILGSLAFRQASLWLGNESLLTHALEVNPISVPMSNNLATYYLSIDPPRPDLAKPLVDLAIRYGPDSLFTLGNRIECMSMLGQLSEVQPELDRLSVLLDDPAMDSSQRVRRLSHVSSVLLSNGRYAEALSWARRALAISPHAPIAQQAVAAAQRALAAHPATLPSTQATTATTRP